MRFEEIRNRIEAGFESWGHRVVRYRALAIALPLIFSGFFIAQLPRATFDTSIEGFLLEDDPTLATYNAFRDQFGRDDRMIIAVKPPALFSLEFAAKLRAFHEDLENEVTHLDDVDSLINARSTRGEADELVVEELFESWPETPTELDVIEARTRSNRLYPNLLVSRDYRYTTVSLEFATYGHAGDPEFAGFEDEPPAEEDEPRYLTGVELIEAVTDVREVVARYEGPDFPVWMAGAPIMNERMTLEMTRDMRRSLGFCALMTIGFLFVLLRRVSGTFIPVGVVLLSLLTTLGMTPAMGIPLQQPTQILPAFLLAVGVGDSVHILAIFYQRIAQGATREDAIAGALGHSGLAVLLTTLTTAGALASFLTAELAPIRNLGILGPIGVVLALLYTLTLLPAILAITPVRSTGHRVARLGALNRMLAWSAHVSSTRPVSVIVISFVLLGGCIAAATQLRFSHNPLAWFPPGDEIRTGFDAINDHMGGAVTVEVIFDTGAENGLHSPRLLSRIADIQESNHTFRRGAISVGKSFSIVDIVKETHQALNENRETFYRIPDSRPLVAQELLLFENSGAEDLEDVTDSLFSKARMTMRLPWVDAIQYPDVLDELRSDYQARVGDEAEVTITGLMPLLSRTFKAVISSMTRSYILAILVIAPLMMLLLGSFRMGLLSMIPNLAPIVVMLGTMGAFDLPLDGFTLLCGSVALGLAVDDTIHFMHNFRRYYDQTGDGAEAIRRTLSTTGQAMFITTLVLCSGFFLFMTGNMLATFYFGFLTGLALAVAFLADILLAPALMMLVTRWRERDRTA